MTSASRHFTTAALTLGAVMLSASLVLGQEGDAPVATGGTRSSVALTIYNQGTALVRDSRSFTFAAGANTLLFTDVAAGIDPTSVQFRSVTDPENTTVLEQSYLFDLVDSFTLLNRYLDQVIRIVATDGTEFRGTLLSARNGDIILRTEGGEIVVINQAQVRDLRFPELPGGLITRPTLRWLVQSAAEGAQDVELTYLTSGMNWTSDYVVLLAPAGDSLDLNGWITLTNTSGASFTDAQVKLVAGDVNRLPEPAVLRAEVMMMDAVAASAPVPQVEQRDFNEYKLYEIVRPVTVADNETKQVEFVSGTDIGAGTFFVYDASQPWYGGGPIIDQYYGSTGITTVGQYLEWTTGPESGLDAPLPAGRVRVYQEDTDGAALLIGENTIAHTPVGETVSLFLGNAFDLVGERTQTAYNLLASNVLEETYTITLRNRKAEGAVEVRVPEHLSRWSNWEIVSTSQPFTQLDSNTIEYRAQVPAGGETVITYTVRYTFPR
jgi:hypothetical protein